MPSDGRASSENERRLNEALAEYLEAEEAGRPLDHEEFLARNPDLASELEDFFENRAELASLPVRDPAATIALPPSEMVAASGPPPPDRFGDYELLGEIARGGMGVVYKARQVSANRDVALKMILADQQEAASARRRFRIEAEAAANLDHPNIVPIYDVGEIDNQPYFTMKLVEEGSLASRSREFVLEGSASDNGPPLARAERRTRQQRIAEVLAAVARAVHHAHQHGILHRDLRWLCR